MPSKLTYPLSLSGCTVLIGFHFPVAHLKTIHVFSYIKPCLNFTGTRTEICSLTASLEALPLPLYIVYIAGLMPTRPFIPSGSSLLKQIDLNVPSAEVVAATFADEAFLFSRQCCLQWRKTEVHGGSCALERSSAHLIHKRNGQEGKQKRLDNTTVFLFFTTLDLILQHILYYIVLHMKVCTSLLSQKLLLSFSFLFPGLRLCSSCFNFI